MSKKILQQYDNKSAFGIGIGCHNYPSHPISKIELYIFTYIYTKLVLGYDYTDWTLYDFGTPLHAGLRSVEWEDFLIHPDLFNRSLHPAINIATFIRQGLMFGRAW